MTISTTALSDILARWDSGEGKPYKGELIDFDAYKRDPDNIGCMCAQGQVLHLLGGWSPKRLRNADQKKVDKVTAKLLNISIAHSILLRRINDEVDGAPSVVLTNPEKVLGDQAKVVLAFWLHLDGMEAKDWEKVAAAMNAAWNADWDAAAAINRGASWDATWAAARAITCDIAWIATKAGARSAISAAANACGEIQGAKLIRERGQPFFFLPMFGFAEPESIPALPADYGVTA